MRLLVDSTYVFSPGGIRMRDELVAALVDERPCGCEVALVAPDEAKVEVRGDSRRLTLVRRQADRAWWSRRQWYNRTLPEIARAQGADVVYTLSGMLSAPLCRGFGTVTSYNNMEPLSEKAMRAHGRLTKGYLRCALLRREFRRSARDAGAVLVHSTYALEQVARQAPEVAGKAFMALTGPARDLVDGALPAGAHPLKGEPYLLYLSTIYPYKNHLGLVRAYDLARRRAADLPPLLLAGFAEDRAYLSRVLATVRATGLADRIRYLGALPREQVGAWLHHATINLYPSTCESIGLGIGEVLGVGGVLACSGMEPMLESVRYAGEFFDPFSVDSMARAILALHADPARQRELRTLARRRAAELSWKDCGATAWSAAAHALRRHRASMGRA